MSGYPPFWDEDENEMIDSILNARFEYLSPDWDEISDNAKQFISSLITVNPIRRLTCEQALQHVWLNDKQENKNLIEKVGQKLQVYMKAKRKVKVRLLIGGHQSH